MSEINEETKKEKRPKSKVKKGQRNKKIDSELLKKQKEILRINQERKTEQYKQVEEYINETGLDIAFNIIFAELISKQILPENFFTYTAMRLKQIGKEIEGMNTKIPIYVDKPKTDENGENQNKTEGDENKNDEDNVFMTAQKNK